MAISLRTLGMDGLSTTSPAAALEQRLLALTGELLCAIGPDGRLQAGNPAWHTALGWSADELSVTPFLELVTDEDRSAVETALEAQVAEFECRMCCADGSERLLAWSLDAEAGEDVVLLAGREIGERRRLETELQEFVYTASHDLAEPLRMVTSYLELLQRRYEGKLDETADEFIGFAIGGAMRMRALLDDLLTFSRAGSEPLAVTPMDLGAVLAGVAESLDRVIDEAGATVEVAGTPPVVSGDAAQIAQLFRQVVANAVKFRSAERPSVVSIAAAGEDGGVRVDVGDNGIGIDPAQHERVFKIFARLHGRDDFEGTGVGLALCRRIAERHGGRVWLDSAPGAGTTVHVWLPKA
ncbi:MAG: hypothetical protein QOJ60_717 [Actinomycetota bacterium]|nr:hypothetical protein [Actinomycetota bacterium]